MGFQLKLFGRLGKILIKLLISFEIFFDLNQQSPNTDYKCAKAGMNFKYFGASFFSGISMRKFPDTISL